MTGVSERLTSANDALRGLPGLRLWLIAKIGAFIYTTSCLYQVHEEIINVNASFNYQTV
jgi:hypothetical protein